MKHLALSLFSALGIAAACLCGCHGGQRGDDVAAAWALLADARLQLADGRFDEARAGIMALRRDHPTAVAVRREALLTLDSVELMQTRDSLVRYEPELEALRQEAAALPPRVDGHTNDAYYAAQRRLRAAEQHYDELCAKVQFYLRKLDVDRKAS